MIVKIPKNIDETEARIMYGLTMRKMIGFGLAGGVALLLYFKLHAPVFVSGVLGGAILFLIIYQKQGMSAPTLIKRYFESKISSVPYIREPIVRLRVQSQKEQTKAAEKWNKWLKGYKRKHPKAEIVKTVRCSNSRKTRK